MKLPLNAAVLFLFSLSSVLAASTLNEELQINLATHMDQAKDLAVDGTGNMWVLGMSGPVGGATNAVYKFSASGALVATFSVQAQIRAPQRLAITASGRVVVAGSCGEPDCRAPDIGGKLS